MSDYNDDQFEEAEAQPNEAKHLLKLSVDLLSVKDFQSSANLVVQYSLKLV